MEKSETLAVIDSIEVFTRVIGSLERLAEDNEDREVIVCANHSIKILRKLTTHYFKPSPEDHDFCFICGRNFRDGKAHFSRQNN